MYNRTSMVDGSRHSKNKDNIQKQKLHQNIIESAGQVQMQHRICTFVQPKSQYSDVALSTVNSNLNNIPIKIKTENNQSTEDENTKVKWPIKNKSNKKQQKKLLLSKVRRLIGPKSPLVVFSELYKDVPIKLVEQQSSNNGIVYSASIEVDGKVYMRDHISKIQAKQKACEHFLREMLAKKLNESSNQKEENVEENDMNISKNVKSLKPKGPQQDDFPWSHFASLAMHKLIDHWEIHSIEKNMQDYKTTNTLAKVRGMKKFPDNPKTYNPVQLLHQMIPGVIMTVVTISNNPTSFRVFCEIDNIEFNGIGLSKKAAKKECAIQAIKQIWNFDFSSDEQILQPL